MRSWSLRRSNCVKNMNEWSRYWFAANHSLVEIHCPIPEGKCDQQSTPVTISNARSLLHSHNSFLSTDEYICCSPIPQSIDRGKVAFAAKEVILFSTRMCCLFVWYLFFSPLFIVRKSLSRMFFLSCLRVATNSIPHWLTHSTETQYLFYSSIVRWFHFHSIDCSFG